MAYYLNLYSPETWAAAKERNFDLSGFRLRQKGVAQKIKPGDILLCYIAGVSRWSGALRVTSTVYEDSSPVYSDPDPFVIRFKTEPLFAFDLERSIPIFVDSIWLKLSDTKDIPKGRTRWAVAFRGSLRSIEDQDAAVLLEHLQKQADSPETYPLTERDRRQMKRRAILPTATESVVVEVPDEEEDDAQEQADAPEIASAQERESLQIQGLLATIGTTLGFKIWIAPGDRKKVAAMPRVNEESLLHTLPFRYDDRVMTTIQQIDVIWIRDRYIVRAFEVEDTTAVYSGLLRMADLVALQPNLDVKLHIVAAESRRDKVLRELRRPVFALLENGLMQKKCSYLSYDALKEISQLKHLIMMKDQVLEAFEEHADDYA